MNDQKNREVILYEFAVEPIHDQKTLERYLLKYPDLADDLVDLSYELRVSDSIAPSSEPLVEEVPAWQQAWQQFVGSKPKVVNSERADNPFVNFRGQAFVELANLLKLPRSILSALRDRLVDPASIPEMLISRLAAATELSPDQTRNYFLLPPAMIGTAEFKADKKPGPVGRVTFQKLVESTQMSDEERKCLLEDLISDGRNRG